MDPPTEDASNHSPTATKQKNKQVSENDDDDNLHDDIEDKNASFSEYSVAKA